MNPADVMGLPVGMLDVMDLVVRDEQRAVRLEQAKQRAIRGR